MFIFVFALIPSYFYAASLDMENIRALGNLIACAEEGDVAPGTLARIGLLIQGECDSAAAALDDERPQP